MSTRGFEIGKSGDHRRIIGASALSVLLLFGQSAPLLANPTGGAVVAGAATIGAAGKTLSINQSSNNAIINWQTFSIASGETTRFFVPSSTSTTLNFVAAGNPSAIYGTLASNGRLFLVNPSGILVGASGRIDTAGFLGSTLNPNASGSGTIVFSGDSTAGIKNLGTISASSGNVYLIANEVTNKGSITATQGNVGLAAGSSVLLQQEGDQHLFIQAGPSTKRAVGVTNSGSIQSATAELKAAGGNAYALAINNTGSISASGFKKVNGQVYLTADTGVISNSGSIRATGSSHGGTVHIASKTGTIDNSGIIDVSATAAGGKGGSVSLKSTQGLVSNTGVINAKGGTGGAGGDVDVSGATVDVGSGVVNTLAAGGQTGMFTIDPATLTIAASGGDETGAQVATDLATTDITLNADNAITINDSITWTSGTTLTLSTNVSGSTIAINAPISGGALTIDAASASDLITTSNAGSINVAAFTLQNGTWQQIVGQNGLTTLPAFTASIDFELQNGSTFERFAGGDGSIANPFQVTDVYGLQGIGSPSGNLLADSFVQNNDIDASSTSGWNGGAGFTPIGGNGMASFSGAYNGNDFSISDLTVNLPTGDAALFGQVDASGVGGQGTVEDVNLTADLIIGNNAAGLVAINLGFVEGSSADGTVNGAATSVDVGGLVALNEGVIFESSSSGMVQGGANSGADGGLVGSNPGTVELSFSSAFVTGSNDVGGLVGFNFSSGLVDDSFSSGPVNGTISAGGLVGFNAGTIQASYTTSSVGGSGDVGGLVGKNSSSGTVVASYWATDAGSNQQEGLTTFGLNNGTSDSYTSGQTLSALAEQSTFQPTGDGPGEWDFATTWTTNGNTETPQLLLGGANTGGGTGGTPPVNLIDLASQEDGSGSNLVPVSSVPQNPDVNSSDTDQDGGNGGIFGNTDQSGNGNGGLANSSGNGGLIGPGDSGVIGDGTLGNFSNPAVYSAFGTALGAQVYVSLTDALGLDNGGYYPGDTKPSDVTTVDSGNVIVIEGGKINNVAPADVPAPMKNALNNGAFNSMPGH
jgi:filamentous hemagglutinin family protein